jgi:hypothetical protein
MGGWTREAGRRVGSGLGEVGLSTWDAQRLHGAGWAYGHPQGRKRRCFRSWATVFGHIRFFRPFRG